MLDGDRRRMELAYSLMFTLPGTPVIRYGDEIGMGDNLALPDRQAFRTPMQWSAEPHGGFSAAKRTALPVIDDEVFGYRRVNAADQRRDPDSFLNWIERIVRMRKEVPEIGWGDWQVLGTCSPHVLAIRYEWRGNAVVAVHNVDAKPHTIRPGAKLVNLLSDDHSDGHKITIEGYGYRWYRVGGLGETLSGERA